MQLQKGPRYWYDRAILQHGHGEELLHVANSGIQSNIKARVLSDHCGWGCRYRSS